MKRPNRLTLINIIIFGILTIATISVAIARYKGTGSLYLIFMILIFNLSLGLLCILAINKLTKTSKRGISVFIFYLILVSFFYWYFISSILHFRYGTFISLGGIYFYLATRTLLSAIVFYVASGFVTLSTTAALYYFSRKYIFEKDKKPPKIMSRKLKIVIILTPIFLIAIVLMIMPSEQAYDSSPLIDVITQLLWAKTPGVQPARDISESGEKILNISVDIEKPNFIIILLESISAEHLPLYGYKRNITPNIDKLAEKSIVFDNAFSSAAHSDYAQTTFLSSRYTLINGRRNFFNKDYPREFMWDILKEYDYNTAYISSQDDEWANMISYYNKDTLDLYYHSLTDGETDYGGGNARKDYDEHTIKKAIKWIDEERNSDKPFFTYINLQGTHYSYNYPKTKINRVFTPDETSLFTGYFYIAEGDLIPTINNYDNSILYVDKQVGVLMDYLEEKDLFKNTIIVISADHGESFDQRHENLRHGYGVYNEEVRVPLIFYIPNEKPKAINDRIRHLDVIPTLLDITGFPQSEHFQGEPMRTNPNIFMATQNQNFKLGFIKEDIKYIMDGRNFASEVYNLTKDPLEQNNLIKDAEDEEYYYARYGFALNDWYNCQKKYYKKGNWKKKINCT